MRTRAGARAGLRTRRSCAWPGRCRAGRARTRPPSSRARRGGRRGERCPRPPPAPRPAGGPIAQIVLDQLEGRIRPCRRDRRLLAVAGVVVREGVDADDLAPLGEQRVDQRGPDESRTARDQVARHRRNHSQPTSRRGVRGRVAGVSRREARPPPARRADAAARAPGPRLAVRSPSRAARGFGRGSPSASGWFGPVCASRRTPAPRGRAEAPPARARPPRPGAARRRADQGRAPAGGRTARRPTSRPWRSPSWTSDSSKISSL